MHRLGARLVCVVLALVVTAGSCRQSSPSGPGDRPRVVASFAALAEVARRVGGGGVEVVDLTPAGTEPHDAELRARDLDAIEDADVVLYVGANFQPAVAQAARRAERPVDVLLEEEVDPHIWLDPLRWASAVTAVEQALSAANPAERDGYRSRAASFRADLERLHSSFEQGLRQCRTRVLVSAHDSFGHLARRYQLDAQPITGVSPEAEPDPRRLADLADLIRSRAVATIFTEPLVPSRVAEALAREAGVATAVLDPLESPAPGGYQVAMERNLATLRNALGCS